MKSIMRWFASPCPERSVRRRRSFCPSIDGLESRRVLSTVTAAPGVTVSIQADLNTNVLNFAASHLHQKVGGGECAHLVNEALRVAGADFGVHDPNGNGDYTWGRSSPRSPAAGTAAPRPLASRATSFSSRTSGWPTGGTRPNTPPSWRPSNHGRPTQVYEQNVGVSGKGPGSGAHDRTDRLDTLAVNANTLTSGTVHIYRPIPRVDTAGTVQYSVVNDTTLPQTVTVYFNGNYASRSLSTNSTPCTVTRSAGSRAADPGVGRSALTAGRLP